MKFLNFKFVNSLCIDCAGHMVDLHNQFHLDEHRYYVSRKVFELAFKGELSYGREQGETIKLTDLKMIFRNVEFLRVQDEPCDETNVCFNGIDNLGELVKDHFYSFNNFFSIEEFEEMEKFDGKKIDYNQYFLLRFIWGVNILINAETVEVQFQQTSSLSKSD